LPEKSDTSSLDLISLYASSIPHLCLYRFIREEAVYFFLSNSEGIMFEK
jgi:hypothetical protein